MAVEVQQVVHAGVRVHVLLTPVQQEHQSLVHMVHMQHIHAIMDVKIIVEYVNAQTHVLLKNVLQGQKKQIQEIIMTNMIV